MINGSIVVCIGNGKVTGTDQSSWRICRVGCGLNVWSWMWIECVELDVD